MTADLHVQQAAPKNAAVVPPKFKPLEMPELEYTPGLAKEMAPIYERVKNVIPSVEWPFILDMIVEFYFLLRDFQDSNSSYVPG